MSGWTDAGGRSAGGSRAGGCSASSEGGRWRAAAALLVAAVLPCAAFAGAPPAAATGGRVTPSGQPVPRYVSTRFETVNARAGPGDDYRLVWTYRARGLPLQVLAETDDWRRVCDPDGGLAWVHRRTVGDVRRVMRVSARDLPLRARPTEMANATAMLSGRSLAALRGCRAGWCRITADKTTGWVRAGEVWGTSDARQCR